MKQGGIADKMIYSSLTDKYYSVRDFFISAALWRGALPGVQSKELVIIDRRNEICYERNDGAAVNESNSNRKY